MVESMEIRVARGVQLLNAKFPEWKERITDFSILNLDDPNYCILGQLYGFYRLGVHKLGLLNEEGVMPYIGGPPARYGFTLEEDEIKMYMRKESWESLKSAWIAAIQEQTSRG